MTGRSGPDIEKQMVGLVWAEVLPIENVKNTRAEENSKGIMEIIGQRI